jgi:hypothetical protein
MTEQNKLLAFQAVVGGIEPTTSPLRREPRPLLSVHQFLDT